MWKPLDALGCPRLAPPGSVLEQADHTSDTVLSGVTRSHQPTDSLS